MSEDSSGEYVASQSPVDQYVNSKVSRGCQGYLTYTRSAHKTDTMCCPPDVAHVAHGTRAIWMVAAASLACSDSLECLLGLVFALSRGYLGLDWGPKATYLLCNTCRRTHMRAHTIHLRVHQLIVNTHRM